MPTPPSSSDANSPDNASKLVVGKQVQATPESAEQQIAAHLASDGTLALHNEAQKLMKEDSERRTGQSMMAAIDKELQFAKKEPAVQAYELVSKTNAGPDIGPSDYRQIAVLSTAYGEVKLDQGSPLVGRQGTDYVLAGKDLDFGTKSLQALMMAQASLDKIAEGVDTKGNPGNAQTVPTAEVESLRPVRDRLSADEGRIYGKHDISGSEKELELYARTDATGTVGLLSRVTALADYSTKVKDPRLGAKLLRDLAIYEQSLGELQLRQHDKVGATDFLVHSGSAEPRDLSAKDAIEAARKLEPNNPDLPELDSTQKSLEQKLADMNAGKPVTFDLLPLRQHQLTDSSLLGGVAGGMLGWLGSIVSHGTLHTAMPKPVGLLKSFVVPFVLEGFEGLAYKGLKDKDLALANFLRPTALEAVAVGLSASLPLNYRLAIPVMAAAWALSKGATYLMDRAERS